MSNYIEYLCKIKKFSQKSYYANDAQMFFDYIHGIKEVNEMTNVRFDKESSNTPLSYYNNEAQKFFDYANTLTSEFEIKDCPPDPEPDPEPEESDIQSCEIQNQVCKIKFKQEIEAINFYKGEDIKNVNHQNEGNKNYTLLMYNKENPFENIEIDRIDYKIETADPKKYTYQNCKNLDNTKIIFIDCGIDDTFIHFNFQKIENPDNFYVRFYSQNDEIIYESSKLNNIDNNSGNTILKLEKNIEIRNDEIVKFEILIIDSNEYKLETGELNHSGCIETLNTLSNRVTEVEILQKLKNISFKYFQQDYSESKLLDGLSEVTCEVFLDKDLIICLKNQDEEERLNKPELYDLVFKHSYYFSLKLLTNNSQDESLVSFNNRKNDKIIKSFSELKISKNTIKEQSTNISLTLQICKRKAEEEEILHTIEGIPKLYFTKNILDRIDEGDENDTDIDTDTDTESEEEEPGPHPPGPAEEEIILIDMNEEEEKVKLDGYDDKEFKIYCHDDIIEEYFKIFIENLQYYYTDMIYDRDVMKNYYDIMNYLICLFKYLMNSGDMNINFDTGDEPLTKLFQSERNILDQSCNDTKFKAEPVKDILKIDLIDNLRMGINSLLVNTYQKDMRFLFQDLFYFFIKKNSSNSPNSQELIKDDEDLKIFKINLKKLTIKLVHDYFYSELSDDYLLQNNNNTELDDIDKSYEEVIQKIKECQVLKIIHLFEDYKEELKSQKDKVIENLQGKEDLFSYFGFFD